ncbi:MAG: SGNH/GDSL hydrolase family protein [Planctomycetes bacterium]|nr:SGNH/GDSL hydrolase family protein [Planctomycetota bacterium]
MRLLATLAIAAILFSMTNRSDAQAKKKKKRRPNPALKPIEDEPGLPRALLIGDSISIGYTLPTRALLKGKVNLHRIPANGGDTRRGLDQLDKWLGDKKWDVIHFNWGLHDLKYIKGRQQVPIDQYKKNLTELVERLKKTGAKLIWCATTPAPEGDLKPKRLNSDVIAYNEAAKKIMDANGIVIDDLYTLALPKLNEIQRPVNVHFTPEGSKVLAEQVADCILKALGQN